MLLFLLKCVFTNLQLQSIEDQSKKEETLIQKTEITKSCHDFIQAIKFTENIFGRSLFLKTFLFLVCVILVTFLAVTSLFHPRAFEEWDFFFILTFYLLHGVSGIESNLVDCKR